MKEPWWMKEKEYKIKGWWEVWFVGALILTQIIFSSLAIQGKLDRLIKIQEAQIEQDNYPKGEKDVSKSGSDEKKP
jgi:hypothetical protein